MSLIIEFLILGAFAASLVTVFMILKARIPNNSTYKYAVGTALITAFLLFWVNGAVGIIGSSNDDVNMLFYGVLAVGLLGAILSRFRPSGMARSMFVMMIAQILVAAIAVAARWGSSNPVWPSDVITLTCLFSGLWLACGALFLKAARQRDQFPIGSS